jgi:translation initiation factor 2A
MASQVSQQYAFRAQKSLGLVGGSPEYQPLPGFESPAVPARTYKYSADGRLFAYALPTGIRIFQAEGAQLLQELPLVNIVELNFSPRGTYLSTWERPVKLEDGAQHKNFRIFSVSTGEELTSFTQKSQDNWDLQYTITESHAIRLVSGEIQVYRPAEWSKGIVDKLKVEGATSVSLSPGLNYSMAVFVAEKKGAPASIKIYSLSATASPPSCSKSFYKADRCQIKWNTLGTQVLVLTQKDVDDSNKNYYGETGMYLLSATGDFDCRVALDKQGPIHDFAWSPNSKEFAVIYGYMPAKVMLFDQRVRTLHDFGMGPYNFVSFNPQGRFIALAGFGNLAGKMDIFDRRALNKVCTIDAPNTSHCEWSPDGRFLLTATLSPRLRVDNGVKIWHCTGPLMHTQLAEELYQVSWRPTPLDRVPQLPAQGLPVAPPPAASAVSGASIVKPLAAKPAGAYRPPGARGLATPSIYKREDEGGAPSTPGNATPPRYGRSPGPNGHGQNGRRYVPGAPNSPSPGPEGEKKARKGKKGKKDTAVGPSGMEGARVSLDIEAPAKTNGKMNGHVLELPPVVDPLQADSVPPTPGDSLDPNAKKIRNLNKKLKAIEELKEKAGRGERLEATQLKKIEGEHLIRKELDSLSITV